MPNITPTFSPLFTTTFRWCSRTDVLIMTFRDSQIRRLRYRLQIFHDYFFVMSFIFLDWCDDVIFSPCEGLRELMFLLMRRSFSAFYEPADDDKDAAMQMMPDDDWWADVPMKIRRWGRDADVPKPPKMITPIDDENAFDDISDAAKYFISHLCKIFRWKMWLWTFVPSIDFLSMSISLLIDEVRRQPDVMCAVSWLSPQMMWGRWKWWFHRRCQTLFMMSFLGQHFLEILMMMSFSDDWWCSRRRCAWWWWLFSFSAVIFSPASIFHFSLIIFDDYFDDYADDVMWWWCAVISRAAFIFSLKISQPMYADWCRP